MIFDLLLLLLYSLLPGLAKIFDQQAFFLVNLPIIAFLFLKHKKNIIIRKVDVVFYVFFFYIIVQSLISFFLPYVNQMGLYMGIFMYLIPFTGFFYSRLVEFDVFIDVVIKIVIIHCLFGVVLYPAFGLTDFLGIYYEKLHDGVAFGRMSSVSGSLGFANLMFVGFVLVYHTKGKWYLGIVGLCLIMSLQRSAWLASLFAIMIATIINFRSIGIKKVALFGAFITLGILLLTTIASNEDFDILFSRFSEFGQEAASERSEQWVGGFNNFLTFPQGAGVGQAGQISARYESNPILYIVPDGDFLRVLSEVGFVGLLFYSFVLILLFYSLTTLKVNQKSKVVIISLIFGYSIQMIGSNITEFYFTNFIYWVFVGYFFNLIRIDRVNIDLKAD